MRSKLRTLQLTDDPTVLLRDTWPMPRYRRSHMPGGTFFFTLTLADRSSDLLVRDIARLRQVYAAVRARRPFETIAICVLPDHLHAIWKLPPGDADFSVRWSQIKHGFSYEAGSGASRRISQVGRRERGLWQRRFWEHEVRDDEDLRRHVDYVHFNPVKHRHAQQVGQWPFSSFHRWVARGDLQAEWGLVEAEDGAAFGEAPGG